MKLNLDDPNEVNNFIRTYGNARGRYLANLLGISGMGCTIIANNLSGYAWNKKIAMDCRGRGEIKTAMMYEEICEGIYKRLPKEYRW